jgi:hypothetical protein
MMAKTVRLSMYKIQLEQYSVYLGGAGVTTTSYGYLLSAGADFSIELR